MISKFARRRNVNTSLPFFNKLTYIDSKSGSNTFSFTKVAVSTPSANALILTEAGFTLTNESGINLITG